jgi:hypothetical protein
MPIFLIAQRLLARVRDVHIAVLLGAAAAIVVIGGVLFSVTNKVSVGTGLYWSVTTARRA